jgi:hypothetical protein
VAGTVRQAISVVKNRSGDHERTIREYKVQKGGLLVGEPLTEFQGVLTGVPHYTGSNTPLIAENGNFANGVIDQSSEAGERAKDGVREHARKRGRKKSSR